MVLNLLSAVVVIGGLRVNKLNNTLALNKGAQWLSV